MGCCFRSSRKEKNERIGRFSLKRWSKRGYYITIGLVVLEIGLVVAFLTLSGIADPNTYRTKLWQDGFLNGFNSSPADPIYAAANYRKSFTPLIWSQTLTSYNLVAGILSTFIWILKIILVPLHVMWPIISLLIHSTELALFAYSVYAQTSPDTLNTKQINNGLPWYIAKSCSVSYKESNVQYCIQAKALFYLSCFMLALYSLYVLVTLKTIFFPPRIGNTDQDTDFTRKKFIRFADADEYEYATPVTPKTPFGWGASGMPSPLMTSASTMAVKSPVEPSSSSYGIYAPHAGYATRQAEVERDRVAARRDLYGQAIPLAQPPPITPRTTAFNALEGAGPLKAGGVAGPTPSSMRAEWGKRETGHMPWSGRRSGGSNRGSWRQSGENWQAQQQQPQ